MSYYSPPGDYHTHVDARTKRKRKLPGIAIVGIVLAGLLVACGLGVVVVGLLGAGHADTPQAIAETPSHTAASSPASTLSPSPSPAVALKAPPPTTKAAPPPPPPPVTIEDGTWTVGEDIPAGKYLVKGTGSTCYWEITKSGTNGAGLLNNGLGPGNLRVTLKAGQDFKSQDCGTWVKQ